MPLKKHQASKLPVIMLIKCKRKYIYCKLIQCHERGKRNKLPIMYRKAWGQKLQLTLEWGIHRQKSQYGTGCWQTVAFFSSYKWVWKDGVKSKQKLLNKTAEKGRVESHYEVL